MKSQMNNSLAFVTSAVALLVLVTACGGVDGPIGGTGSPTEKYRDLGPAIPKAEFVPTPVPTPAPPPPEPPKTEVNQVVFPRPTIFEIDKDGKEVEALPRFIEGERREYLVKTQVFAKDVAYTVQLEGMPTTGSNPVTFEPLKNTDKPGYYKLSWNPQVGTLSRTESMGRDYTASLKFVVTNPNKEALPKLVQIADGSSYSFKATLVRNDQSPRIVNIALESNVMYIGDKNLVTVSVTDPSASERDIPEIVATDEVGGSSEKPVLHVGKLIHLQDREYKNGTFYFRLLLDTRSLFDQVSSLKAETEGRFVIRVVGATSGKITAETKSLTFVKKAEAAPETAPTPSAKGTTTTSAKGTTVKPAQKGAKS